MGGILTSASERVPVASIGERGNFGDMGLDIVVSLSLSIEAEDVDDTDDDADAVGLLDFSDDDDDDDDDVDVFGLDISYCFIYNT